jgi:hypothetical protein
VLGGEAAEEFGGVFIWVVSSSMKRTKVRVRVRWCVEGNRAHVHMAIGMGFAVLVEFSV